MGSGTEPPTSSTPAPSPSDPNFCLEEGQTRTDYLLQELSLFTAEDRLLNSSTPEGQAFLFMTETDPLFPNVCTYPTLTQRYGLATFYYSTTGDQWTDSTGWLGEEGECLWLGITCDTDGIVATNMTLRK